MTDENEFINQLKPEEIVDCFVLPHGLSRSEKAEADAELIKILNKKRASVQDTTSLDDAILQNKKLIRTGF